MASRKMKKPRRARRAIPQLSTSVAITGVDLDRDCSAKVPCLRAAGKSFVARYYASPNSKKILTVAEAKAISAAGMRIVAVWEDGLPTSSAYFSYSEGVDDGTSAYNSALKIGQSAGTPIYFAVDYDATDKDIAGGINDYFRGVTDGFATISAHAAVHSIGVYGSGAVCTWLLTRKMVTYAWLAQSTGWRGYRTFSAWNIKQYRETTCCSLRVDPNEATEDYGGFQVL
jgi:hypothetical protein